MAAQACSCSFPAPLRLECATAGFGDAVSRAFEVLTEHFGISERDERSACRLPEPVGTAIRSHLAQRGPLRQCQCG